MLQFIQPPSGIISSWRSQDHYMLSVKVWIYNYNGTYNITRSQDRQLTYNVTLRCVCITTVTVEKQ